jgi:hypothetical protein
MEVTTCHSYEIFYKYRYSCEGCGHEFGRQSKSVNLARQRCGRCHGTLRLLGACNRDGTVTAAKTREPSAFANFVKQHYPALKASRPRASHKDLMATLGERWRSGGAGWESDAADEQDGDDELEERELCAAMSDRWQIATGADGSAEE